VLAACVLFILSPLFLAIGLWIRRDSPGEILFRQPRLGLHGSQFHIFKFRSMYKDAEDRLQHILQEDPELRREFDIFHKLRDDPRVTRAGRFLRRWSLDELPQLINVVRGEMNLVGPRAYLPAEEIRMEDAAEVILSRKPGITGLWQVSGRNDISFCERVNLERWYVEHRSAFLDLKILLRTLRVIVSGKGAN
jgi:lipopolysaccharide/colanic/teichoic acid biosynthesis glycosyltransferase